MIKIKNFIAQIVTGKNLKWVLVFLVVGGLFVGKTYAKDFSSLDSISWLLHIFLAIVSWVWILLANLAGKLMTNDMVYGSFLHLDNTLWTLRNIMKNFANFALGFMVLYAIVKNMISGPLGKEDKDWSPLNVIKKTLIAGVLIQMSWFFMGATIDLSTIMTSAIGSFPSQFISSNDNFRGNINNNLRGLQKGKIVFDAKNKEELVKWVPEDHEDLDDADLNKLLDTLMPSHDSVAGPLLFLGLSVFDFNDFDKYSRLGSKTSGDTKWGDMFLSLSMDAIVLIAFSLMMFMMFIFNLFRVIMLWIIIPLTPIIVLLKVFGLTDKINSGGSAGMDLKKFLDIKTILTLIFKPVLMVGTLSLILVILVLIQNMIAPNKVGTVALGDQSNVSLTTVEDGDGTYTSTMESDGIVAFSMSNLKDTIADIIVYFFGLFLIYFLVKMVVKTDTGIGFIDNSLNGLMDTFEGMAKNLPVIPIGGGVGLSAFQGMETENVATKMMGIDVAAQMRGMPGWMGGGEISKQEFINEAIANYASEAKSKTEFLNLVSEDQAQHNKTTTNRVSEDDLKTAYTTYTSSNDKKSKSELGKK